MLQVILNDVWEVSDEVEMGEPLHNTWRMELTPTQTGERRAMSFDLVSMSFLTTILVNDFDKTTVQLPPDIRPRELKNLANWLKRGAPR